MSRLVKKPVMVPSGVTAAVRGDILSIKGPKGELEVALRGGTVEVHGAELRAVAGTLWALARNAIEGVTKGFTKTLEVEGVGYRIVPEGKELVLYLGYAQPIRMQVPEGVIVKVEKNLVTVEGIDKDLVGRTAAAIRAHKKPEPYKGKGIHYRGETIRRKVGKKAATAGAAS